MKVVKEFPSAEQWLQKIAFTQEGILAFAIPAGQLMIVISAGEIVSNRSLVDVL